MKKQHFCMGIVCILPTIVCFTSVGLFLNFKRVWIVIVVFYVCCRTCLGWMRRASVSDQKSTRTISFPQFHPFRSTHPSHMLSSDPQKDFPSPFISFIASTQCKLWTLFLAREHSLISLFAGFLSESLPSHSFPSCFLFSPSVFFTRRPIV